MEQFIAQKNAGEIKIQTAQKYLVRYLGELKLHFNLKDEEIAKITRNAYFQINKETVVQKCLNMLKSFLR